MTTEEPNNINMEDGSNNKPIEDTSEGKIQKLQKKVLRGQELSQQEAEYLASHATAGVTGYLKQKFPNTDVNGIILAYASEQLKGEVLTEKMVTGICYEIQFTFDKFKEWVRANKKRFANKK